MEVAEQNSLKGKVVRGVFWRLSEHMGTQVVGFVVGMILARLLGPEAYGTIALLSIFLAISSVLVSCGFGTALIQKKSVTELDFNSVFFLSVAVSLVLYAVLFFAAPWIAAFYRLPILVPVLRVQALVLIFHAINGVQDAVLLRKMLFNLSFRISLATTITSGVTGITMAFCGCGVWSLVGSSMAGGVMSTAMRWALIGWRPRLAFSFTALKPLFNFSWKLVVSGLLDTFFVNLYGLLIGRIYTPVELALYNRGRSMPEIVMSAVNGSLGAVAFPALSQLQDDRVRLKAAMRKMIQVSTFIIMPLLGLLAAAAEPMTLFLFGEKWRGSIVFVQIATVVYAFWPFHTINLQGIQAVGRSDVFLKLEILKKCICVMTIFVVCKFGVVTFALVGAFVSTPLSVLINSWPNRKLLNYGILEQLHDASMALAIALSIFVCAFPATWLGAETWLGRCGEMALQGCIAAVVFGLAVWLFKPEAWRTLVLQFPLPGCLLWLRKGC